MCSLGCKALNRIFGLLLAGVLLIAQSSAFAQPKPAYTQQELDQMLAPIALYPDPLLSQILMASTYPLEVLEAAAWTRAYPGLSGDVAVRAVADRDWDPSVKSLVAFPQVLARMVEQFDWTRNLGDAFLAQEPHVMDTIQTLRQRAQAAGTLQSDERQRVFASGPMLVIEPARPQVVYVPYYDPHVVYGPWWWPAHPPVYWAPWPGYAVVHRPGLRAGFAWGSPIGVSLGFFFGTLDWHHRHVRVVHVNNYYYRRPAAVNHVYVRNAAPGRWQHEPRREAPAAAAIVRPIPVVPFTRMETRTEARAPQPRPDASANRIERREARPAENRPPAIANPSPLREPRSAAVLPAPQAAPQPVRIERREERRENREPRREARPAENRPHLIANPAPAPLREQRSAVVPVAPQAAPQPIRAAPDPRANGGGRVQPATPREHRRAANTSGNVGQPAVDARGRGGAELR
jgi:hypothetical protein